MTYRTTPTRRLFVSALRALCAVACWAIAYTPAYSQTEPIEGVAAIVNDEVITQSDVRQRMGYILATTGIQATEDALQSIQAQALASLIDERLQLQKAAEFEVAISTNEVQRALTDLAQQNNLAPETIVNDLASVGVDIRTLEDQLRAQIAWDIVINGLFGSRVRVSDDQIDQFIDRLVETASSPQFLLSEILIEIPISANNDQVMQAVGVVIGQLQQGAPFAAVARQFSAAPSAAQGGDVGWVRSGEIPQEIEQVVNQLRPGQISTPIQTQEGIYIIALREVRPGADPTRLNLKQILIPITSGASDDDVESISDDLERVRRGIDSCDNVEEAAERASNVLVGDLGSVAPSDLAPAFRDAVEQIEPGDVSEPVRVPTGLLALVLCERSLASDIGLPSRQQVENRLLNDQIALAARRFLRDLRRDATIETRAR